MSTILQQLQNWKSSAKPWGKTEEQSTCARIRRFISAKTSKEEQVTEIENQNPSFWSRNGLKISFNLSCLFLNTIWIIPFCVVAPPLMGISYWLYVAHAVLGSITFAMNWFVNGFIWKV